MSTDTKTSFLVINRLTEAQFNNVVNPSETELWLTPDDTDEKLAKKQDKLIAGRDIEIVRQTVPYGYEELEYLAAESGSTAFINTGFKPNQDTRVIADVMTTGTDPNSTSGYSACFGSRTAGNSKIYGHWQVRGIDNTAYRHDFNTTAVASTASESLLNVRVVIDKNKNVETIYKNGTVIATSTNTDVGNFQGDYNMYIFGFNSAGTRIGYESIRIYSFEIYNNGMLISRLMPARRLSDNVLGMYDLVRNVFLTNAGSGSFTAGSVVEKLPVGYTKLDYIKITGTQTINTGVTGNLDTEYEITFQNEENLTSGAGVIFGSRTSATSNSIMTNISLSDVNIVQLNDFGNYTVTRQSIDITSYKYSKFTVRNSKTQRTIYNWTTNTTDTTRTTFDSAFTTPTTLRIADASVMGGLANSHNFIGKIYGCKIWNNGILQRNFVPAQRNSDMVSGLYDVANDVFYTNAGTGIIIPGTPSKDFGNLVINFTGNIPTKTSDLTNDSGFVESSDLATVATSGSYNDLSDKPTIPAAQVNSDWNANSGVAQILNKPTLATVATTGAYSDLSGTPTIPTVNDSTITITQGGVTKGSFTLNQASGDTIALDAGGGSLSSLSDVTLTTPTDGQVLTYDNGDWVNADPTGGYHPDLFSWQWADHQLNDVQWLRADTFSWQDGTVYEAGYDHLTDDINGKSLSSETISGTTIQFYLADDGHKICPASEESNVTAIYTATGVAWYYILDTVNQRFKLPRTKFGVTGLRDTVGKYVEAGLPNITGNATTENPESCNGAFSSTGTRVQGRNGNDGSSSTIINFDASRSSSIYGNGDTVQPKTTEMYLYFYVGNFTQTALENTAGLNAELFNGKADTDLSNTPMATADYVVETQLPTAQNNYTWYRKYKSGWVEQGAYNFMNGYVRGAYFVVTLPITMADADYTVILNFESKTQNYHSGTDFFLFSDNYTTTGFHYLARGGDSNNYQVSSSWMVCGMAA